MNWIFVNSAVSEQEVIDMDKILVVEDELSIRGFIVLNLKHSGFDVLTTSRGEQALQLLREHPDIRIVLLDVMLPGMDGFEICRKIREDGLQNGIIMLTARIQENDKVHGLSNGADDYITKPFSPSEMIARVRSLLRRLNSEPLKKPTEILKSGVFRLTAEDECFYKGAEPIDLTPTEFELVRTLMKNKNQLLSREQLIDAVWGKNFVGDAKIIDVNIRRLRQKIEDDPAQPKYIQTHWGRGYLWDGTEK